MKASSHHLSLLKNPSECDELFNALTFKDSETFKAVEERVLSEIISSKERQGKKCIRIWTAGCASCEEPCLLLILVKEKLGAEVKYFSVAIYSTDVDADCLQKAKEGKYELAFLSQVHGKILRQYFIYDGNYLLADEVKMTVRFSHRDSVKNLPLRHLDLILCRHPFISFTKELQYALILQFHRALNRGGYLVLGKVGTLWAESRKLFKEIDRKEGIYLKV